MYITRTRTGRGYRVEYPEFSGEGYSLANEFYHHFGNAAEEYFKTLTEEEGHLVCSSGFLVEDLEDFFTVVLTLTLRKRGKCLGRRVLTHRWKRWEGRDAILLSEK